MKKHFQRLAAFLFVIAALAACVSPMGMGDSQSSDQVATAAAMTLQALAPQVADKTISLLPRSLYFLGNDTQGIAQIFRMERDGKTKTQLTFEPVRVDDYDISPTDGNIVYVTNNQLLWINADGSNRHLLGDGGTQPVFSPDGRILAYAHGGVNLYDLSSGVNSLVIVDHPTDGSMPLENYVPENFSPDGTKLLISIAHPPDSPSTAAIYSPATQVLMQIGGSDESLTCCNFYGGAEWSADSSTFYAVASQYDSSYKFGVLWKVNANAGAVVELNRAVAEDGTISLPFKPQLAPDGQLYFFLGAYSNASGFFDAPVLHLVRSAPDGVTGRSVLRDENFVLMDEALWAPDASFVIVATAPIKNWDQGGGVLELYPTDRQKSPVWLAPFGREMKWGP
jgi:hypothetical protein